MRLVLEKPRPKYANVVDGQQLCLENSDSAKPPAGLEESRHGRLPPPPAGLASAAQHRAGPENTHRYSSRAEGTGRREVARGGGSEHGAEGASMGQRGQREHRAEGASMGRREYGAETTEEGVQVTGNEQRGGDTESITTSVSCFCPSAHVVVS